MVLEFPPELPNLELPDLSDLPDLDSDLDSSAKSNTDSLGLDLDLDALLSLDSDLNTDFEREFGLTEDSSTDSTSMADLLEQMQADADFSELGILSELGIFDGIEGLEDIVISGSEQPGLESETTTLKIPEDSIQEEMSSSDFVDLLEDFATAETIVTVSKVGNDSTDFSDQFLETQAESTFDLPDLDDGFISSSAQSLAEPLSENLVEPFPETTEESLGELIDSELIGFAMYDLFSETSEPSPVESELPEAIPELNSELGLDVLDAFSSTEENLGSELPELEDYSDNFLDDSLTDFESNVAFVEIVLEVNEEPAELDPFRSAFEQPIIESSVEPELPETPLNLAEQLEEHISEESLEEPSLSEILQDSTELESFTAILSSDSWSVEQARRVVEDDPFSETFGQSLEETFEESPIDGFTAILSSELSEPLPDAAIAEPDLDLADSNPSNLDPVVEDAADDQPIVSESFSESDELEEINSFSLSFEQPGEESPVDDFTQILSSEQVEGTLEPIATATSDVSESREVSESPDQFPEYNQEINQPSEQPNQSLGDLAVASVGVVGGISTNNFMGSDRSGQPLEDSLEQEMASEDAIEPSNDRNGIADSHSDSQSLSESSESPGLLIKIGLAVVLVVVLIGGFALVRSNSNNNQQPQPTQSN